MGNAMSCLSGKRQFTGEGLQKLHTFSPISFFKVGIFIFYFIIGCGASSCSACLPPLWFNILAQPADGETHKIQFHQNPVQAESESEPDPSYIYLFTKSFIHLFIRFPGYPSLVFGCRIQTGSSPLAVMKALRNHRYIFHFRREEVGEVDTIITPRQWNMLVCGNATTPPTGKVKKYTLIARRWKETADDCFRLSLLFASKRKKVERFFWVGGEWSEAEGVTSLGVLVNGSEAWLSSPVCFNPHQGCPVFMEEKTQMCYLTTLFFEKYRRTL